MSPWHSRSLSTIDSLICDSDFIKKKGYQQSNPSPPSTSGRLTSNSADEGGAKVWHSDTMEGLTRASLPSSPGHGDAGFLGQNDTGVDGVLTQMKCGGEWLQGGSWWRFSSSEPGQW
jgi:hypothetical protein